MNTNYCVSTLAHMLTAVWVREMWVVKLTTRRCLQRTVSAVTLNRLATKCQPAGDRPGGG